VEKLIFPYGTANYYSIITENNVYIDRTSFIPLLEEKGRTLIFLRPRRFGKSLLISMLENYYDVRKADEFARLFGHLAIGKDPTPRHNGYFVLRWNFSTVETSGETEQLRQRLYNHMNQTMQAFSFRYEGMFKHTIQVNPGDALATFQSLLANVATTPYPLYLFIDEYDNFANKVLMAQHAGATERYRGLVEGEGLLKTLFQVVKYAMEGQGLERVFITGVSPIVVNDMTSGFNVAENVTFDAELCNLCGFSEAEVASLLQHVGRVCDFSAARVDDALTMMRRFYNGYRFGSDQQSLLYNPTLVHYFLKYLQKWCQYPEEMLDSNLSTDRQKLTYVAALPNGTELIPAALNEQKPLTIFKRAEQFGVDDLYHHEPEQRFLVSLLAYMGVLTLAEAHSAIGELQFVVPNNVTRQLYVEQIQEMLLPTAEGKKQITQVIRTFYQYGTMQVVCDFIEQHYFVLYNNRDYRWANELTVKTMFMTLFAGNTLYMMVSEPALQREYADLAMLVRPQMRQYDILDFLMEFKYIGLAEVKLSGEQVRSMSREELAALPAVAALLDEAQAQAAGYRKTLIATYGDILRLRCFSIVAIGYDRLVWREG